MLRNCFGHLFLPRGGVLLFFVAQNAVIDDAAVVGAYVWLEFFSVDGDEVVGHGFYLGLGVGGALSVVRDI